jgi:hypothetical protein
MAAFFRWSVRIFALLAMLLFGTLMVIFVAVTVDRFGQKQYVTDNVGGLPSVYVITALLVPFCAIFVVGFAWLFYDSFKSPPTLDDEVTPRGPPPPRGPGVRERLGGWATAHRPHRPDWPRWHGRAD